MKTLFTIIRTALVLIVLVIVIAVIARNALVVHIAPPVIQRTLGVPVSLSAARINLLQSSIGIEGVHAGNPQDFPPDTMLNMPELYLEYDLGAFLRDTIHLPSVRLHIDTVTVVQKDGKVNLLALIPPPGEPEEKPDKPRTKRDLQIDHLALKIDTIILKDYSMGDEPSVHTIRLAMNEEFENITNPSVIGTIIATRVLMNSTIASIVNIDIDNYLKRIDLDALKETALSLPLLRDEDGVTLQESITRALSTNDVGETFKDLEDAAKSLRQLF